MSDVTIFDHIDFDGLPGDAHRRNAAAEQFQALGWPNKRLEAWHYTDLRALRSIEFGTPRAAEIDPSVLPSNDLPRLVFVNGRFDAANSSAIEGFSQSSGGADSAPKGDLPMVLLNTALTTDGMALSVPEGVDAGAVMLISYAQADVPVAVSPRHRIELGKGAKLTLIEVNEGRGVYLHNPVMEVTIGEAARINHYRLQNEGGEAFHLATVFADVATGAAYESFTLNRGGRLSRNEFHVALGGAQASVHLNAAQILRDHQHGDITSVVSHDAPSCSSRQTVKSVLMDHARGVFQGRIEVARVAQKTDGYQMNQALLLSPDAEIDSKPELEIFADDVKCSHGATIGALDPEQIFYLRSRGIPEAEARAMLIRAFLDEALEPVTHPAAHELFERAIGDWWRSAAL
jgi:Fe-S cluster assembly protein SufD